jgi:hypothetical protein
MHWHEHFHEDEGLAWMRSLMTDTLASFKKM